MLTDATSGLSSTRSTVPIPVFSSSSSASTSLPTATFSFARGRYSVIGSSFAQLAPYLDKAARLIREAVDLREAKTGAFSNGFGGEEGVKHFRSNIVRNADAFVRDAYVYVISP